MGDTPHTASPLQHLRAARATATFATAYASQVNQEFMTTSRKLESHKKMLKMKEPPGIYMKTKENRK
jgi:hypothetical protein